MNFRILAIALVILSIVNVCRAGDDKKDAVLDPEIEKELKAAGWTDIKGSWKKVKPHIYEVTDGKLETNKTDGTLSVTVDGGKGTTGVYVRNGHEAKDYVIPGLNNMVTHIVSHTGYGVEVQDEKKAEFLGPVQIPDRKPYYVPAKKSDLVLKPGEKTAISITVKDVGLDIDVNGKHPISHTTFKISKDGPFAIIVTGTMTIESPTVKD
jgi:hypothetical protein